MFVDPYLSTITNFAGNFAPLNWAYCDGSLLSIAENSALFSLIGTTYGGDGQVTFALPDLRGRYAIHAGSGPGLPIYGLGEMSGSESTTLISTNLPAHTHAVLQTTGAPQASADNGAESNPSNAVPAGIASRYSNAGSDGSLASIIATVPSSVAGSNAPVSNLAPYLAMNYIICVEGIFPSRS